MLNLRWKGFYLEPKRVLQRVILWGQPKIPFRFWIAPVFSKSVRRTGGALLVPQQFIEMVTSYLHHSLHFWVVLHQWNNQPSTFFVQKEGKYILQGDTVPAVIRYYPRGPFFVFFVSESHLSTHQSSVRTDRDIHLTQVRFHLFCVVVNHKDWLS